VAHVALNDVWVMLRRCAAGYDATETDHHYCIRYNGLTYPTLPLGEHGPRHNPEIKRGHVRQMVRQLALEPDCVNRFFPGLLKKSTEDEA
jgi:hypothetical protein